MIRRDFLKRCGLIATGVALADPIAKAETAINITGSGASVLDDEKSDIHIKLRSQGRTMTNLSQLSLSVLVIEGDCMLSMRRPITIISR